MMPSSMGEASRAPLPESIFRQRSEVNQDHKNLPPFTLTLT